MMPVQELEDRFAKFATTPAASSFDDRFGKFADAPAAIGMGDVRMAERGAATPPSREVTTLAPKEEATAPVVQPRRTPAQTLHEHRQEVAPQRLPGQPEESLLDPLLDLLAPLGKVPLTGIAAQLRRGLDTPEGRALADTARGLASPENAAIIGTLGVANAIPIVGPAADVAAAGYFGKQMIESGIAAEAEIQAAQRNAADARKRGDEKAAKEFDDKARYARAQKYISSTFLVLIGKSGTKKVIDSATGHITDTPRLSPEEVRARIARDQRQAQTQGDARVERAEARDAAKTKPSQAERRATTEVPETPMSRDDPSLHAPVEYSYGDLEVKPANTPVEVAAPPEAPPPPEIIPEGQPAAENGITKASDIPPLTLELLRKHGIAPEDFARSLTAEAHPADLAAAERTAESRTVPPAEAAAMPEGATEEPAAVTMREGKVVAAVPEAEVSAAEPQAEVPETPGAKAPAQDIVGPQQSLAESHEALKNHPARGTANQLFTGPMYARPRFEERLKAGAEKATGGELEDYLAKLKTTAETHLPDNPFLAENIEEAGQALKVGNRNAFALSAERARSRISTAFHEQLTAGAAKKAGIEVPKPITVTDKSVRDFPQQVRLDGGTITVTHKIGPVKQGGAVSIPLAEWLETEKNTPTFNSDYNKAELLRKYFPDIEEAYQAGARIKNAIGSAIDRAVKERAGQAPLKPAAKPRTPKPAPSPEVPATPRDRAIHDTATSEMDRFAQEFNPNKQSLVEFLKSKGGVKDEGGTLASREPDRNRIKNSRGNLIQSKTGMPLERAMEAAVEEGYLPAGPDTDLFDLIDQELRGQKVYSALHKGVSLSEEPALEGIAATPAQVKNALATRKGPYFQKIQDAFRRQVEKDHGEAIDEHLAKPAETEAPQTLQELHDALAAKQQESRTQALSELAAGRRPEQLKEGKTFDETRLVESELFGGEGGPQQGMFEDEVPFSRTRSPLPVSTSTAPGEIVAKSQILRDLSAKLGIPLRVGRFRGRAWGIFKVKPEVARVKIANDVATAAHEFGHAINKIMYGTKAGAGVSLNWQPLSPFAGELRKIATEPRAGQSPIPEGFAEFVRMYLTDPAEAAAKVPKFSAFFKSELDRFPELRDTLQTSQKDIGRWINQPAVAKVLSAISMKEPPAARNRWSEFYTNIIDKLEPVRAAVEAMGGTPTDANAYKAARLFAGWAGKADTFLERGTFDAKTNALTGPSFKEILKPVEGDLDNFRAYLVARRVVEKSNQGIETGIEKADAIATVKILDQTNPGFRQSAASMYRYNDSLMDYLIQRGIISAEQAVSIKKLNMDYVPFFRAFETEAAGVPKRAGTEFGNVGAAVHRMYGSGRDIIDPLESTIKNTYALINLAERNEVSRILVDQAKAVNGGGKFVERVPQKMEATKFELSQIKKDLEAAGIDVEDADLETMATVFKPGHEAGGKDNILSVVRDGKREYYQVEPTLYRSLQGLDDAGSHLLVRLLSVPAQALRVGATALSPEFAARNIFRDAFTAFMQSEYGFKPGIDTVRGIFHAFKQDDLYWEWKRSGGEHAAMVSMDRTRLQQNLKDLMASPVKYAVRHPLEALKMISEFGEAGTRIGEYALARSKGASAADASLASRDVSVDFARHGAKTRSLNSIVAFWNANVQGMDQFARLHKAYPLRSMVRGMAGLTLPSLILYSVNKDNEKYNELPRWRRDLFWNIPTDGTPIAKYTPFIAIPKPFEWGMVYASVPERIAEWIYTKKPEAFDSLGWNMVQVASPGIVPTAAIPPFEAWANKSLFTGRAIVPAHLQRLEPEFQYEYYSSEFSKMAARTLAGIHRKTGADLRVSPMQIDNAIFGYSGGFGRLVADMTNPPLRALSGQPQPPSKQASDYPILRGFAVRYPSGTTESMQKFYNRLSELEKKHSTQTANRKGVITGATPMTAAENRQYLILNAANGFVQERHRKERQIVASSLSPAEKRKQIDAIDLQIQARVKRAVSQK